MNIDLVLLVKLIIFYLSTMLLYFSVVDKRLRFIFTLVLYVIGVILFRIDMKSGLLYLLVGVAAVITEHIFIKYFIDTWDYRNPDIFQIPYWLFPLWGIAIIIVVQLATMIKNL